MNAHHTHIAMKHTLLALALACISFTSLKGATSYNQNITSIFGSGNPDTGWTVATAPEVELALRAKNRENASTANVNGTYQEPAGLQAPNNNRARWNFELSIDSGASSLDTYSYYLVIDLDPSTSVTQSATVDVLSFWSDNSYGTSATLNGQGLEGPASTYASTSTVVQQSQNIVFYGLNANLDATYTYTLYAVAQGDGPNGEPLASVTITVVVGAGGVVLPDDDGDGVPNVVDECPGTAPGDAVNTDGCSITQSVLSECLAENPSNHGAFVSCVTQKANTLFKQDVIDKATRTSLIRGAAKSNVGK